MSATAPWGTAQALQPGPDLCVLTPTDSSGCNEINFPCTLYYFLSTPKMLLVFLLQNFEYPGLHGWEAFLTH